MRLFLLLFSLGFVLETSGQSIYYIRFPNDTFIEQCSDPKWLTNRPQFYNPDSLNLAAEYYDENWLLPEPACIAFTRLWKIYDSATYDSSRPCIEVPNPRLYSPSTNPLNFPGPVVSPVSTPGFEWSATESRLWITDTVSVNFSVYWDSFPNCYHYYQRIFANDTIAPSWVGCTPDALFFSDTTANDPDLWNGAGTPANGDLSEGPVDLFALAYDSCSVSCSYSFQLFLDLDQDSIPETVVPYHNNLPAGAIRFGNINTPNYSGGELFMFDNRPVVPAERYRFVLKYQFDSSGAQLGGFLRWAHWEAGKYVYKIPHFPPGAHQIHWQAWDACGNEIACTTPFAVAGVVPAKEAPAAGVPRRLRNTPNPFREHTLLEFDLPAEGPAFMAIHDLTGRLLWSAKGLFPAGNQQLELTSAMTGHAQGLLRFSVQTTQGAASRLLLALPPER